MRVHARVFCLSTAIAAALSAQPCEPQWDIAIGNPGVSSTVGTLLEYDFGAGKRVLAGGLFWMPFEGKAAWNGSAWEPIGPRFGGIVTDYKIYDDGAGERLYVCGNLFADAQYHVARLDGNEWTYLDAGGVYSVSEMIVWDDGTGPALFVTGDFETLDGVTTHNCIAKWDGQQWHSLGAGLNAPGTQIGLTLEVFDDGSGEKLYLGGTFQKVDSEPISYLARWDGSEWTGFGGGPTNTVDDLCVHNDGTGAALYAVGFFDSAAGKAVYHVAKWDGIEWSDLDGGTNGGSGLNSCGVFDDGTGLQLYVSGQIRSASGKPMCNIAKWDGTEWHDPGGGLECGTTQGAFALLGLPPDSPFGPSLFAGGSFHQAGGQPTNFIAEYRGCFCLPDWNGDGTVNTQDFLAYLNDWAARDPRADLNSDGVINTLDFLAFLNAWAAGC